MAGFSDILNVPLGPPRGAELPPTRNANPSRAESAYRQSLADALKSSPAKPSTKRPTGTEDGAPQFEAVAPPDGPADASAAECEAETDIAESAAGGIVLPLGSMRPVNYDVPPPPAGLVNQFRPRTESVPTVISDTSTEPSPFAADGDASATHELPPLTIVVTTEEVAGTTSGATFSGQTPSQVVPAMQEMENPPVTTPAAGPVPANDLVAIGGQAEPVPSPEPLPNNLVPETRLKNPSSETNLAEPFTQPAPALSTIEGRPQIPSELVPTETPGNISAPTVMPFADDAVTDSEPSSKPIPPAASVPSVTVMPQPARVSSNPAAVGATDETLTAPQPVPVVNESPVTPPLPDAASTPEKPTSTEKTASATPTADAKSNAATDLVARVAHAIRTADQQQRPLRVRLHPPELGVLQVEITSRGGQVTARLEVQTVAAQQALVESLPALRESLAQHGNSVGRLDVQLVEPAGTDAKLDRGGYGSNGSSRQDTHDSDRREPPAEPHDSSTETSHPTRTTPPARRGVLGELDVQA